jgi:hypothetical protein
MNYEYFAQIVAYLLVLLLLESIAASHSDVQPRYYMEYLLLYPHRFPSLFETNSVSLMVSDYSGL